MTLLNDGIRYSSAISAATTALVSRQVSYWQMPVVRMVQSPPHAVPYSQQRTAPPHVTQFQH